MLVAVLGREFLLLKRNIQFLFISTFQIAFVAFIVSTAFPRMPKVLMLCSRSASQLHIMAFPWHIVDELHGLLSWYGLLRILVPGCVADLPWLLPV